MRKDALQEMFDRQRQLAGNFIPIENLFQGYASEEERARYLQTYWQLLIEEGVEFLRELPQRKFWRASSKEKRIQYEKLYEELADIWHIVIALSLIAGIDAKDIYAEYIRKNDINLDRVRNNL